MLLGTPAATSISIWQPPPVEGAFPVDDQFWLTMLKHMINVWAFGLSGIALLYVGYFIFDKLTPGIHFTRELVDNKNIAVAIVLGSLLLGVSLIVAAMLIG
jgi:putative membrane protein